MITEEKWPIAFLSQKPTEMQQHYTVIDIEFLAAVDTQKEFTGMLCDQQIKVYIDNEILIEEPLD